MTEAEWFERTRLTRADELERALVAAELGDYSLINALGITPGKDAPFYVDDDGGEPGGGEYDPLTEEQINGIVGTYGAWSLMKRRLKW